MRVFLLDDLEPVEPDPCPDIIKKAAALYKKPLNKLEPKKSIEQLYEEAESDLPIGHWVTENYVKPGELAACLPTPKPKKKGRGI